MKKIYLFACILFMASCGSTAILTPTASDVERGKNKFPDLTLNDLTAGKSHFEQKCTQCHGVKNPQKHSPEEWKSVIEEMAEKAERKSGKEKIDAATKASIEKYLSVMAEAKK